MIKKITNIRFSDSKQSKHNKLIKAKARRNRLLSGSDWTQLPDSSLTVKSKIQWSYWRKCLRALNPSELGLEKFINEINKLEEKRENISTEYEFDPEHLEEYRERLFTLFWESYKKRTKNKPVDTEEERMKLHFKLRLEGANTPRSLIDAESEIIDYYGY